jgi:hypothetical protein
VFDTSKSVDSCGDATNVFTTDDFDSPDFVESNTFDILELFDCEESDICDTSREFDVSEESDSCDTFDALAFSASSTSETYEEFETSDATTRSADPCISDACVLSDFDEFDISNE